MLTGRHPLHRAATPRAGLARGDRRPLPAAEPDGDAMPRRASSCARSKASTAGRRPAREPASAHTARWWWEFHQAVAALRLLADGDPGLDRARADRRMAGPRLVHRSTLAAVIVGRQPAAASVVHVALLPWRARVAARARRTMDSRRRLAVRAHAGGRRRCSSATSGSPLAILLLSFGIGAAVAFLVIEPATTRAAFRTSKTSRSTEPQGLRNHGLGPRARKAQCPRISGR